MLIDEIYTFARVIVFPRKVVCVKLYRE